MFCFLLLPLSLSFAGSLPSCADIGEDDLIVEFSITCGRRTETRIPNSDGEVVGGKRATAGPKTHRGPNR